MSNYYLDSTRKSIIEAVANAEANPALVSELRARFAPESLPPAQSESYAREQREKALETGAGAVRITIAVNDTWGACRKDGGSTSSYEKLGYHSGTRELMAGFLESGTPIEVYRHGTGWIRIAG
jgi:hypothetical protein